MADFPNESIEWTLGAGTYYVLVWPIAMQAAPP